MRRKHSWATAENDKLENPRRYNITNGLTVAAIVSAPTSRKLSNNALSTLPEGVFQPLTALRVL